MRLIQLASVVGCGLVFLVAGCGSGTPSGATSTTTTPAPTSISASVPNSLSLAKLNSNPCDALTATELQPYIGALRKSQSDPGEGANGPGCDYFPIDGNQATIGVTALPNFGGPANLGQPGLEWSQKIGDVAGYPAEHASAAGPKGPQGGDCATVVVISDQAAVHIYVQAAEPDYKYYTNACAPANALAPDVIAFLKSGG